MARTNISNRVERILTIERPGSGLMTKGAWLILAALAAPVLYAAAAVEVSPAGIPYQAASLPIAVEPVNPPPPSSQTPAAGTANPPQNTSAPRPRIESDSGGEAVIRTWPRGEIVWSVRTPQAAGIGNQERQEPSQQSPDSFSFVMTDVQNDTVRFSGGPGTRFISNAFTCKDCTFLLWDAGVAGPISGAIESFRGVAFKLSEDGKELSVTCRAQECKLAKPGNVTLTFANKTVVLTLRDDLKIANSQVLSLQDQTLTFGETVTLSSEAPISFTVRP